VKRASLRGARVMPKGLMGGGSWQQRLRTIVHQPSRDEVRDFLRATVRPAFEAVVEELRRQERSAHIAEGEDGRIWIDIPHGSEEGFYYLVRPRAYEPPAFLLRDTNKARMEKHKSYRAEVHFKEGGQDYDIMGWSCDEVIHDVLDQYERHLHYLKSL
jgi:choline/glycine/proline betaine transport protein